MNINIGKIGVLLIVWAFFMGLIGFGLTWPMLLLVVGSVIYLLT